MAIFSPKTPTESELFTADFSRVLGKGVVITSGTVTCSVLTGTDATPSAMISGSAVPTQNEAGEVGKCLSQKITGGILGNRYLLSFKATASDGTSPEIQGDVWIAAQVQ